MKKLNLKINSEVGKLRGVIIHTPGEELENMTPENAEKALYSDILSLSVASREYAQFRGVLKKLVDNVFEVEDLLIDILKDENIKKELINKISENENLEYIKNSLLNMDYKELAHTLITGLPLKRNTLSDYLKEERYSLVPLHNLFFTRDASVSIGNEVSISKMASKVRAREAIIMEAIFKYSNLINTETFRPDYSNDNITIEGGDILIAGKDILCIGMGPRTTAQGIDSIVEHFKSGNIKKHIIIQELPHQPESFIHLDMVFTFLDTDTCMIYEPVILNDRYRTIHIDNTGENVVINDEKNLLVALENLGMKLNPMFCGGKDDIWHQEREQWHSGANFLTLAPGKIIGYSRNTHTIDYLGSHGFEVIKADDVISGKINPDKFEKFVITIQGSELARGGGGCRCMSMPVLRDDI